MAATFNAAMAAGPRHAAVATAYNFSDIARLVDVGGGSGALLTAILQAHPSVHGVLFDTPAMIAGAAQVLERAGVAERCAVIGGDFFTTLPSGADGYLLSAVLSDWDDERAVQILTNCRRAMVADGWLVVVEWLIVPGNEPSLVKLTDLSMLVELGGCQRTAEELGNLFTRAGFQLTGTIVTAVGWTVFEGRPAEASG